MNINSNTNNRDFQSAISLALNHNSNEDGDGDGSSNDSNNESFEQAFGSLLKDEQTPSLLTHLQQRNKKIDDQTLTTIQTDAAKSETFPQILRNMLDDDAHGDTISWCSNHFGIGNEHGSIDAHLWHIVNIAKLVVLLPNYFNHGKYSSFLRQIYRWGFKRYSRDCYFHEVGTIFQTAC